MKEEINYFDRVGKFVTNYLTVEKESEGIIFKRLVNIIGEDKFNDMMEQTKDQTNNYNGEDYSFTSFHKMFRQIDVVNVDIDMIIWHFVHISEVPQKVYYGIQNKKLNGKPCEKGFLYFEKDWIE
jgi:hypothetical protein